MSAGCGTSSGGSPPTGTGGASGGGGGMPSAGDGGMLTTAGASGASSGAGGGGAAGAAGLGGFSGAAGEGGSSGASGAAGLEAGGGGVPSDSCPLSPAPRRTAGTLVELPVELTLDGAPVLFGESNPLPGGGTLTPLGVRFYVSEVALLRTAADPLPVDIVTAAGAVAPYGVFLFNAEDEASTTLRVLAPPGEYGGLTFAWGLAQACNTRNPDAASEPLSATSQMSWPHTGFLFFRYEARVAFPGQGGAGAGGAGAGGMTAGGAGVGGGGAGGMSSGDPIPAGAGGSAGGPASAYPPVIHMGGNLLEALVPIIRVEGTLSVPETGPVQKGLRLALDQVFEGALSDVELTGFVAPPGPVGEEVLLGERLRRSVPELTLFSFRP